MAIVKGRIVAKYVGSYVLPTIWVDSIPTIWSNIQSPRFQLNNGSVVEVDWNIFNFYKVGDFFSIDTAWSLGEWAVVLLLVFSIVFAVGIFTLMIVPNPFLFH